MSYKHLVVFYFIWLTKVGKAITDTVVIMVSTAVVSSVAFLYPYLAFHRARQKIETP